MIEFDIYDFGVDLFEMECAECEKVYVVGQLTIDGRYVAQITFTEHATDFDCDAVEEGLNFLVDDYYATYIYDD